MPLPKVVARANRKITNPITRRFAGRLAPFALVEHRGRKSGKLFRTPVMTFTHRNDRIFALSYGKDVDWVKNVLAADGCTVEYKRQRIRLAGPALVRGSPNDQPLPAFVRMILRF